MSMTSVSDMEFGGAGGINRFSGGAAVESFFDCIPDEVNCKLPLPEDIFGVMPGSANALLDVSDNSVSSAARDDGVNASGDVSFDKCAMGLKSLNSRVNALLLGALVMQYVYGLVRATAECLLTHGEQTSVLEVIGATFGVKRDACASFGQSDLEPAKLRLRSLPQRGHVAEDGLQLQCCQRSLKRCFLSPSSKLRERQRQGTLVFYNTRYRRRGRSSAERLIEIDSAWSRLLKNVENRRKLSKLRMFGKGCMVSEVISGNGVCEGSMEELTESTKVCITDSVNGSKKTVGEVGVENTPVKMNLLSENGVNVCEQELKNVVNASEGTMGSSLLNDFELETFSSLSVGEVQCIDSAEMSQEEWYLCSEYPQDFLSNKLGVEASHSENSEFASLVSSPCVEVGFAADPGGQIEASGDTVVNVSSTELQSVCVSDDSESRAVGTNECVSVECGVQVSKNVIDRAVQVSNSVVDSGVQAAAGTVDTGVQVEGIRQEIERCMQDSMTEVESKCKCEIGGENVCMKQSECLSSLDVSKRGENDLDESDCMFGLFFSGEREKEMSEKCELPGFEREFVTEQDGSIEEDSEWCNNEVRDYLSWRDEEALCPDELGYADVMFGISDDHFQVEKGVGVNEVVKGEGDETVYDCKIECKDSGEQPSDLVECSVPVGFSQKLKGKKRPREKGKRQLPQHVESQYVLPLVSEPECVLPVRIEPVDQVHLQNEEQEWEDRRRKVFERIAGVDTMRKVYASMSKYPCLLD